MFKRDDAGEIIPSAGSDYYDDNIPYDGVYIHYAKRIAEVRSSAEGKRQAFSRCR